MKTRNVFKMNLEYYLHQIIFKRTAQTKIKCKTD